MSKDYEQNIKMNQAGEEHYYAENGEVFQLIRSDAPKGKSDNCHICAFELKDEYGHASLAPDCKKIGDVCITSTQPVHFVKV